MKPTDETESLMRLLRVTTSQALHDRVLADSFEAMTTVRTRHLALPGQIRQAAGSLMQNRYGRAAAAGLAVAIGLCLAWLAFVANGTVYAFPETVQAMHSVRSLHMKFAHGASLQADAAESWAEFDSTGQVIRCCLDYPQSDDGHKIVYWQDEKAQVWFKDKNAFLTIADKSVAWRMLSMATTNDPKTLVSHLQDAQAQGQASIATRQPFAAGQPIILTVTYLPTSPQPGRRQILKVDPATKLVMSIDKYQKTDNQYQLRERFEILDYNQPINPAVFNPQLPEGIIRFDQTAQQAGLPQDGMSDKQVATEVVRRFFQALIDKEYATAARLLNNLPEAKVREAFFGKMHVVRIVSVGEPTAGRESKGLRVPVTIEVEEDGQVRQWSPDGPLVRPVEKDPTRWQIIGGI